MSGEKNAVGKDTSKHPYGAIASDEPDPENPESPKQRWDYHVEDHFHSIQIPKWGFQIALCVVYCLIGIFYYQQSALAWPPITTLYFTIVSVSTLGYGDLVPIEDADKIFTVFYIFFGVGVLFGAFASFMEKIFDDIEERAHDRLKESQHDRAEGVTHKRNKIPENDSDIDQTMRRKVLILLGEIWISIVVGGAIISGMEGWSYATGFYWAFQTTTTVGYGDLTLSNTPSKIFAVSYAVITIVLVARAIGNIAAASEEASFERKRRALLRRELDMDMITAMDKDGDGVDRGEFVCGMLVAMGIVDEDDILPLLQRFDDLDADGSGRLDAEDLELLAQNGTIRRFGRR